jgi:serine/threonine-protein kinase
VEAKRTGDMIEGFRVLGELGQGAASIIYLAHDPRTKQVCALKHVKKESPKDQRFLDQALYEYEVASKLNHPRLRRIYKVIRKKQRLIAVKELFLVMELVDGESLEKGTNLSLSSVVDIFHQVAEGLAHMHEKGYVHADMKPNNIVVSDKVECKIIDLGQSCKINTIKPRIQGTPDYIAPEQVHRKAITPKTDIYNLGATMYWVLTKRTIPTAMPRGGDSLMNSVESHLIEKAKPVRELNPQVPERLEKLIMECIEPDPDKRPPNMQAVLDRLNLVLGILRAQEARERGELHDESSDGEATRFGQEQAGLTTRPGE